MASPQRVEKLRELIREEVSEIIHRVLKDPRIGFTSVTDVELSSDLRHAKIFVSVLGSEEDRRRTMEALQNAVGFVRTELGRRIRIYRTPEIQFRLDTSIERGARVMELLRSLSAPQEEPGRAEDDGDGAGTDRTGP
ncbi:MAG: 30S ribosome-binding factor RbfA [Armatimonadota bacterium]|nr:30S ribosome-binding factor RbfA [Armatimonadota bacterium]MDR7438413.1 30S ribosome-binding factor RbfA [Armatimonadota bacterium]MDR7562212.1 30S ribosome-binding factor RbfA [Armatimonadota bacterium]MDR7567192.1 30S ribosome-binding factor RbfA [Armatimonadota bacterium]MDR7601257.1 30S ribosome-binding factor RbfA [Armatimonadota bacterium]